jgi:hypothetical protein
MKGAIQSEAFGRAALRSERYRIIGVIVVLSLMAPPLLRGLVFPRPQEPRRLTVYLGFWICCAGYESIMLFIATRAQRANRPVRTLRRSMLCRARGPISAFTTQSVLAGERWS